VSPKIVIVGFGPHGRRIADAVLVPAAVVDLRAEALEAAPAWAMRCETLAEALLIQMDAVLITTNGPSHAPLAIEALEAGVPRVMVEKPMGCSVEECDRMIDVARRKNARLSVDQSRRHDPLYRWLRDQLRAKTWGDVRAIWIQRPGIGLGCLATHSFDLVRFLVDGEVRRVTAWVDAPKGKNPRGAEFIDPGGLVVLELDQCRATIAQIEDGAGPMSVEIDCTAGRVRVDERTGAVEIVARDLSVKPGPNQKAAYATTSPPAEIATKPDMAVMLRGVVGELMGDGPMDCDAVHGRAAVEILVAAHLSARRGNVPVALPLEGDDRKLWLPVT
jgi:predicted dehydrogenase